LKGIYYDVCPKEKKRMDEYRGCRSLQRYNQRLCLPSSLSSAEPVLAENDEAEEALVIPLEISSAALALCDASLVISLTLSLA